MKPISLAALCAVTGALLFSTGVSAEPAAGLTPFKIEQTLQPHFPSSLLLDAVTQGDVWVLVSVGADGKLTDFLVTRYTHRALADQVKYLLGQWRYEAAKQNGQPVNACGELHIHFAVTGAVISMSPMATVASLTAFVREVPYVTNLCRPDELDQTPTATHTVTPAPPPGVAGAKAIIDFIIDESGMPRMPVLVSATHSEFAQLSAAALAQWKFTPPTRRGQPVAVPARQEFVFPARS